MLRIFEIKKRPFQFFVLKLCTFLLILFVLDYVIGNILGYFYFRQKSGAEYRITYSMEATNADLLIFGSSRANHHYQSDIFEKRLDVSCYNTGEDGNNIFNDYATLKAVLKRYSPKMIILDLKEKEFIKERESYDELSSLLPYYGRHPEIRPIVELKSPFEKIKLLSSIYPYNSLVVTIAAGNQKFNLARRGDIKGYVPLKQTWDGKIEIDTVEYKYEVDSLKVKYFESFIKDCIDSKIRLLICCSPYLIKSNYSECSLALGKTIAGKYKIPFFDFSRDAAFLKPGLFANTTHLNDDGARIFSNILIDTLVKNSEAAMSLVSKR